MVGNKLTCVQLACWIYSVGLGMQQRDGATWFENQRAIGHDYFATILPREIMVILWRPYSCALCACKSLERNPFYNSSACMSLGTSHALKERRLQVVRKQPFL